LGEREGEITFQVDEQRCVARAGAFANMPVGSPHGFMNETSKPARMLISVAPAGLEKMFMEAGHGRLCSAGGLTHLLLT